MTSTKRGAPRGNHNAVKHGFYSQAFKRGEASALSQPLKGRLDDEIALLRVLIADLARRVKADDLSFHDSLSALQTVSLGISRLYSLYFVNTRIKAGAPDQQALVGLFKSLGATDEDIYAESGVWPQGWVPVPRTSGAQPGKVNALKHGWYATVFNAETLQRLEQLDPSAVLEETALLRTLVKRVARCLLSEEQQLPLPDYLKASRVVFHALHSLQKLEHLRALVFHEAGGLSRILEQAVDEARRDLLKGTKYEP